MNRSEIVTAVVRSIGEVLQREVTDVTEDTRLFDDLQLDSTSILELLMAVEDTMDVEVDPEGLDMDSFRTIGTLADYLQGLVDLVATGNAG
ncbi:acyl carrier protein [Microbispora sp. RL4-1S]|uniref:Acyl carrier protein n=1 Tax=Microbispora oryzae TaxID=2806554 RepID=A0A940WJR1_9ACTN|nr:acyl carrier protein [Microbispora oryzae]MBP2706801.1 acyl carrier protein [Microbispora oryzae]